MFLFGFLLCKFLLNELITQNSFCKIGSITIIGNAAHNLLNLFIEGGCHAGFGSYGPQDGDGVPTITGEVQIAETVRLLAAFLDTTKE